MTVVIDGTRTQALVKFGDGHNSWQRARETTYVIEACTPQQAVAHLAINSEVGCVVRCRRGPKGGWLGLCYIDATFGYGVGKFVVMCSKGWELHLGWLRSMSATDASAFMQHHLDAARYAAMCGSGPKPFKQAISRIYRPEKT